MESRKYYSQRQAGSLGKINLDDFKEIFQSIYSDFRSRGYFDEYLGQLCVDGDSPGKAGSNIEGYVLRKLRKKGLWPISETYKYYSEGDLFDIIEFLFDHVSKPLEIGSWYHTWSDCGYHYVNFDKFIGESEFRSELNQFLNDYGAGHELSERGEILTLLEPEFRPLLEASIPTEDKENIEERIKNATDKYRKYAATFVERKEAVRALADCLEYLRPELKTVFMSSDESDLFNIINNFGIRHHNTKQKTNYDENIWLSLMFYFYLATIHAALRLIRREKMVGATPP